MTTQKLVRTVAVLAGIGALVVFGGKAIDKLARSV